MKDFSEIKDELIESELYSVEETPRNVFQQKVHVIFEPIKVGVFLLMLKTSNYDCSDKKRFKVSDFDRLDLKVLEYGTRYKSPQESYRNIDFRCDKRFTELHLLNDPLTINDIITMIKWCQLYTNAGVFIE